MYRPARLLLRVGPSFNMTQTMPSGSLLRMTGISKSFPGVKALEKVDFAVGPAEIHAFLGENGAGKSTLLKILSGAQAPDAGAIELDGKPVAFVSPHDRSEERV